MEIREGEWWQRQYQDPGGGNAAGCGWRSCHRAAGTRARHALRPSPDSFSGGGAESTSKYRPAAGSYWPLLMRMCVFEAGSPEPSQAPRENTADSGDKDSA